MRIDGDDGGSSGSTRRARRRLRTQGARYRVSEARSLLRRTCGGWKVLDLILDGEIGARRSLPSSPSKRTVAPARIGDLCESGSGPHGIPGEAARTSASEPLRVQVAVSSELLARTTRSALESRRPQPWAEAEPGEPPDVLGVGCGPSARNAFDRGASVDGATARRAICGSPSRPRRSLLPGFVRAVRREWLRRGGSRRPGRWLRLGPRPRGRSAAWAQCSASSGLIAAAPFLGGVPGLRRGGDRRGGGGGLRRRGPRAGARLPREAATRGTARASARSSRPSAHGGPAA